MPIRVLIKTFTKDQMEAVLNHYNTNKTADEAPLERLDRTEGGFKIQLQESQWKIDPRFGFAGSDDKIRQVRWSNGQLLSMGYIGFTEKQYMLLYESLVYGFGGNVILE
jgi:hypothetical protein